MKIKEITSYLESFAPVLLQEDYDNAGLIVGNPETDVTGILVTIDSTEVIIDEATRIGANLIIAHHPIVLSGLKKINGKNTKKKIVLLVNQKKSWLL